MTLEQLKKRRDFLSNLFLVYGIGLASLAQFSKNFWAQFSKNFWALVGFLIGSFSFIFVAWLQVKTVSLISKKTAEKERQERKELILGRLEEKNV